MATTILLLIAVLLAIAVLPWLDHRDVTEMRHTDLMAGDEGLG